MKTILFPTDFSSTAFNAAHYALRFARQVKAEKIVLYHAYQTPLNVGADIVMPVSLLDIDTFKDAAETSIQNFKAQLLPEAEGIELETVTELNLLLGDMNDICKEHHIDIIIMGLTGGGALEETLIGSNAISIAKHTTVPAIVVPPSSAYTTIKNVLLVSDFKEVEKITPAEPIKKILDDTAAALHVLNVSNGSSDETDEPSIESFTLQHLFKEYNPQFKLIHSPLFVESINEYATEINADLIIVIPKKHGLFEAIFKRSHTKMLAFHSHVPLMVVHK